MAGNKANLKTVKVDMDEYNKKIKEHRKGMAKKVISVVFILLIVIVSFLLWRSVRSYNSYSVIRENKRTDSKAAKYQEFDGKILGYSNDGAVYMSKDYELLWNQAFEMKAPRIDEAGKYLLIYDYGGSTLFIITPDGVEKKIETTKPIQRACIAKQGSVAVLMKEGNVSYVKLFNKSGKELAGGEFYQDKGTFPVDVALSTDAQKLGVCMLDVSNGNVSTTISFYNFGSVGQNEIDNNVGTYTYQDVMIPKIKYVSANRMIAFGDTQILMFEGSQKPEQKAELKIDYQIESLFYNDTYIGTTSAVPTEDGIHHHIVVYDMKGKIIMENDTGMSYKEIEFLDNNEICIRNDKQCEIYTTHGIKKFSYAFENSLVKIMSGMTSRDYTFIFEEETQEVRLR